MCRSAKPTLQNHGGIEGCRWAKLGFYLRIIEDENGKLCKGSTLSIKLREVRQAVEIPTVSSAIIIVSVL